MEGQSIDITDLSDGDYCLVSTADPLGLIEEQSDGNNEAAVKISIEPDDTVTVLPNVC